MPQNVVRPVEMAKAQPSSGAHLFYNLPRRNPISNTKMGLSHTLQSMRLAALQRRDMFRHRIVFARIIGAGADCRFLSFRPPSKSQAAVLRFFLDGGKGY